MGLFSKKPKNTLPEDTKEKSSGEVIKNEELSIPDPLEFYKAKAEEYKARLYFDITGCKSKAAFEEDIESYHENKPYTLIALTVNLERVNKGLGRKKGDEALNAVVEIYCKYFPDFYRIGGEKFNILSKDADKTMKDMNFANVELAKYLVANHLDIDIYYGFCRTDEPDLIELTPKELVMVALDRMYIDRANKNPVSPEAIKAELEVKKLQKVLEKRDELVKQLAEQEAKEEKQEAEEDMKSITAELGSFFDEMTEVRSEATKSKEILEQIRKDEEENNVPYIPGFPFEKDELMESIKRKHINTMWFFQSSIEISDEKSDYNKLRFWVYPLEIKRPPQTINCLVIVEDDRGNRHFYSGMNVKAGVGNTEFYINSRFQQNSEGVTEYKVSITHREKMPDDTPDPYKIVKRTDKAHPGVCTPHHFGKTFFDYELFPIRKNTDGLMECVIRKPDGELIECKGNLKHDNQRYQTLFNGNFFEIVEV